MKQLYKQNKMKKNLIFYKHKLFQYTDDRDETWYELVWFKDYVTKNKKYNTKVLIL